MLESQQPSFPEEVRKLYTRPELYESCFIIMRDRDPAAYGKAIEVFAPALKLPETPVRLMEEARDALPRIASPTERPTPDAEAAQRHKLLQEMPILQAVSEIARVMARDDDVTPEDTPHLVQTALQAMAGSESEDFAGAAYQSYRELLAPIFVEASKDAEDNTHRRAQAALQVIWPETTSEQTTA